MFSAAAAGDAGGSDAVGTATASMLGLCEMAGEPSAELWERYLRGSDALEQGEGEGQQDAEEPVQAALCALGLLPEHIRKRLDIQRLLLCGGHPSPAR